MKLMLRYEFLPFFNVAELVKLALVNKEFLMLVDPNRYLVETDGSSNFKSYVDGYQMAPSGKPVDQGYGSIE